MKRYLPITILMLLLGCTEKELQIERLDGSTISKSKLESKIQSLISDADVSGVSIAIFNDNEAAFQESFGYANYEKKDSLNNNTVFYGASFSKAIFGYLVAQLASDGIIDLDKALQEYLDKPLPDYEFEKEWRGYKNLKNDKRYELITARMCLTHSTGFPNWRWMTRDFDFFPEGKIRFLIDPGTRYSYSGEGISLLQFVVEKITNKGLEELAQERIFSPLDMNMTSYVWQERFENQYCHGHTSQKEIIPKDIADESNAAGSIETTLEDYSKFIKHILEQYELGSKSTELMLEKQVSIKSKQQFGFKSWENSNENDNIDLGYGLGWGLLNTPYGKGAFKEGHSDGFQHYSIIFPDKKMGIIILTNSDNGESIFKELLELTIGDIYTPWKWQRYIPYDYEEE